jgi:hypothetical protein
VAKIARFGGWGLLGLLVAIQFVPVRRTNPPVVMEPVAPEDVITVLKRSCYDCHSNETRWPWYAWVAPVSWQVVRDVRLARGDLNFSEWPALDVEGEREALKDIYEEVEEGEMPLWSYKLIHPDARLSDRDRRILLEWARISRGS